jgi:hypothetical protein
MKIRGSIIYRLLLLPIIILLILGCNERQHPIRIDPLSDGLQIQFAVDELTNLPRSKGMKIQFSDLGSIDTSIIISGNNKALLAKGNTPAIGVNGKIQIEGADAAVEMYGGWCQQSKLPSMGLVV